MARRDVFLTVQKLLDAQMCRCQRMKNSQTTSKFGIHLLSRQSRPGDPDYIQVLLVKVDTKPPQFDHWFIKRQQGLEVVKLG
jgi:hypothetical protein